MPQHRARTRKTPLPDVSRKPHAASCRAIRQVLAVVYQGSQATMADELEWNFTLVSHLVAGRRAVAAQHVGAILRVLPREHSHLGLALMAAWLQEAADAAQEGYAITVKKTAA